MPLFKTIEELRPFLPLAYVNTTANMPAFEQAEEDHLVPVIGRLLYATLQEHYDDDGLTPDDEALLKRCRAVVAPFAYLGNLPFLQTKMTDAGLVRLENENSRGAWKWEYNEAVEGLRAKGYAALENLINFLRDNYATYPDWQSAPYNDATGFGLIRNGDDLRSVFALQIRQPHRVYMLIKPLLQQVADLYLKDALGAEFYAVFNDRLVREAFTAEDDRLAGLLRPAAARWVMSIASVELSLRIAEGGFTVADGSHLKDNAEEGRSQPGTMQIERFREQLGATAAQYFSRALDYLNRTASEEIFPEFYASTLYVDPNAAQEDSNANYIGLFVAGR